MPAEIDEFDPREWALPGEEPSDDSVPFPGSAHVGEDWHRREFDRIHCHGRYTKALIAWFDAHPDADFLDWINTRRRAARDDVTHG